MNITIAAQAATLAANRTAYSLAREVLGLRAQVAELRTQAIDAEIVRRGYCRCCEEISELKAALVEEGEPVPIGPAVALVHRLKEERAQLRDTLANMEAEEGKEITALEQEIEAANDIASDLATRLDLVRQALGVPVEPHQSLDERLLEAAQRQAKLAALAEKFARARGRHQSQHAMCDMMEAFGLRCTRPGKGKPATLEGYQPRVEDRASTSPPTSR